MSSLPVFFFVFSVLLSQFPTNSIASDFCIADLSQPDGPAGYPCKDPSKVTVDDFVYSGLAVPSGNTTNFYNSAIRSINIEQFPGLNGMKISMLRADLDVSGVTPFHAHRVAELLLGVEGSVVAGFIDSNNTTYYKTLNKGEVLIIPQHYCTSFTMWIQLQLLHIHFIQVMNIMYKLLTLLCSKATYHQKCLTRSLHLIMQKCRSSRSSLEALIYSHDII
ncbi:Auxin-binding protein ABP19a [Bienertia sinuspersici]